jgi:hypothetical protein
MNSCRKKRTLLVFSVFTHPRKAPRRTKFSVEATLGISRYLFASFAPSIYPTTASNLLLLAVNEEIEKIIIKKKQSEPSFFFLFCI